MRYNRYRYRYICRSNIDISMDIDIDLQQSPKRFEHGCSMIYAGVPSFFALGLEDGHVGTFWRLL